MEESQERNERSNGGSFAHSQVSSEITKLQKEQANGDAQSDSGHLIDLVSESIEVHKFNDPVNDAHNWLDEESSNEKHTGLINSEDEQLANSNFELNGVEILESNQCVICCGRLTDGRVLTCLHRACYSCAIEEAYSIADKLQSNSCNKEIECPKCSQITSLAHLVKDLISLKPEDENHLVGAAPVLGVCTACKNGEKAIGKCDTCKSELCSCCVSAHQTMRCFETHSLVVCDFAASNAGLKCTKHVGEYLEYFCSTCREFCCRTCLRNAHMSTSELNGASSPHTYYQIDEKLIQKSAQHLKYIIEESKEKLAPCNELIADLNACIDELSLNKESVKQAIDEQYHSIKAHLDKYHQELIGQLNIMHQQRRLQLWDSINSCQKAIERVEETISYANLFASENFEVQRQNFIEFIKLKELIAYQLQMLINYASADISKHKKALSSDVAVRASGISFKTADLKTMEATLPKYFGELLPPNNLNQSSNERDVSRHQISFGNGEAQIHLDFASSRRSVAFPRPDVGSNLIKSFSPVSTTPTAVQADHLLCSSRSVIASGMPEVKLKPNFYSSLSTEDNEFYSTQPSLIKANIATGLNLKIDNHTASDYSPNDVSLRSPRGETLDLSDANIQMNLAQLALIHNADNQHGSSKVLSATLSRQASFGNSAASPGNSPFIMNDETLKNISELAKLTQQQNGLPSFTTSLTTPTPPSSSGNTPPLPFPNVSPRPGSKVNIMQIRSKFGQLGTQKGHFSSPHGFCLGVDEEIVVADTNNHRICFFDKNGEFRHMFGVPGKDDGQLWYPRKVAVLRANGPGGVSTPRYVVCDRGSERSRMQIFSRNGHFIRKIAIRYIDIVAGLAITPSGYIVAVDSVSPTVFVIAESGDLLRWFDCSEHMGEPSDIAVNGQEFYICDFKGHCVVVFSEDGHFLRRIGREGITNFPNGIDISDAGDILVGDSHGNRFHVTVFGKDGVPLSEFECPHIKVSRCCGLKITREGYVITLAKNNHHVLILNTLYIM